MAGFFEELGNGLKSRFLGGLLQDDDELIKQYVPQPALAGLSPEDMKGLASNVRSTTRASLFDDNDFSGRFDNIQKRALADISMRQAQAAAARQQQMGQQVESEITSATAPTINPMMALAAPGGQVGPTQARADNIGKANPNQVGLNQARDDAFTNMATKYAMQGDMKRADEVVKFAKTLNPSFKFASKSTVFGPDGKPIERVIGEDGTTKDVGGTAYESKDRDTGGQIQRYDPYTNKPIGSINKTQTPDSVASNATAMRGQNMSSASAAAGRAQSASQFGITQANTQKGQYDADRGVMVNPRTGIATPVTMAGAPLGVKDKAPTEFQGKSAAFGARAEESNRLLTSLAGKYDPAAVNSKLAVANTPLLGGILGAAVNKFGMSAADQQAEQAQRDFVNATLRQESGAAIGKDEFDNASKQYFPQPGDGADVIAQKTRNRMLAIQGFKTNAGRASFSAPAAPSNDGWSITERK